MKHATVSAPALPSSSPPAAVNSCLERQEQTLFAPPREQALSLGDLVAQLQSQAELAPLLDEPMADPFVLSLSENDPGGARTAGLWMIATTSNQPFAFRLYRFNSSLQAWQPHLVDGKHCALFPEGRLPEWWNQGEPCSFEPELPRDLLIARWAPEVDVRNGRLTLHYTARDRQGILRSAYATAEAIDGEWTCQGFLDINLRARDVAADFPGTPWGEENPVLGMIDGHVASVIDEAGRERTFLLTKVDGNALRWRDARTGEMRKAPTPILSREFVQGPDGRIEWLGEARVLTTNQSHHDGLIEGQFVIKADGEAYLVYSAGFFGNSEYRTYVAKVDLLGHEVKEERLLIDSSSRALGQSWNGPGHPSFVKLGEGLFSMYLHVWRDGTDYEQCGDLRKVVQLHVSFRDLHGGAQAPFVVEDALKSGRLDSKPVFGSGAEGLTGTDDR